MATSQPIALPVQTQSSHDYTMGSYSADNFNPASYTRHFLGSPISWRAGSFGARFPQGSPSAQLFSSLDHPKNPQLDVMNAFNVFDREGELCRNYTCCGIHLHDLHALLEHFEEVHVRVVDPNAPPQIQVPFNPQCGQPQHQPPPPSFDPDEMELELDLDNSTQPPQHRTRPSQHDPNPPQHNYHQYHPAFHNPHSSPYSSKPPSPTSTNPTTHLQPVGVHFPHAGPGTPTVITHPEDAFNSYARFAADYSSHMPGTQLNASGGEEIVINGVALADYPGFVHPGGPGVGTTHPQGQQCIPPALLFASSPSSPTLSSSNAETGTTTTASSNRLRLKVRGAASTPATPSSSSVVPSTTTSTAASTPAHTPPHTPLPPAPASMLLSKPFRCPKPNCNKSYKQANGLKYHMTHGSCNFAPPKDLEHVKDLLEIKRREREANGGLSRSASVSAGPRSELAEDTSSTTGGAGQEPGLVHPAYGDLGSITETELREVEREAEKRLKPFACGVGDCQRRYKNMNGLRYHYQHSGDHGAVGLALLAGGVHECLGNTNSGGAGSSGVGGSGSGNGHDRSGSDGKSKGYGQGHMVDEREGRRRGGAPNAGAGVHRSNGRSGSASVPASRAGSVSRVGTPAPPLPSQQTATTPFTPGYTNLGTLNTGRGTHSNSASPPLTPLTTAVNGLGLRSQPHSPTHASFHSTQQVNPSPPLRSSPRSPPAMSQAQQVSQGLVQQQQMAYQLAELQRMQYMQVQAQFQQQQQQQQAQAQAQAQAQQYHLQQQQQQQHHMQMEYVDAQAQREFVEAQMQMREWQQQVQQQQQQH